VLYFLASKHRNPSAVTASPRIAATCLRVKLRKSLFGWTINGLTPGSGNLSESAAGRGSLRARLAD